MFVLTFSIILQFLSLCSFSTIAVIVIPSIFGIDLGIRHVYINLLMKVFKWGTMNEKVDSDENLRTGSSEDIISKENSIYHLESLSESSTDHHKKFELSDVVYLIKSGIEAVIDDEVTKRFRAEELSSWNLLTRTNVQHQFISVRLSVVYYIGVLFRYCILLPMRLIITTFAMVWLLVTMLPLAYTRDSELKRRIAYYVNIVSFRIICRGFTAVVDYHDRENLPKNSGICVANHTTVLDAAVLMQDRPYAILGQIHGGYLGWVMRTMSRATKHVWFERSEARDRRFVSQRIIDHVSDNNNYPVLLFPEGTCINNTSVMMFKKGSFEIPTTIYPVAIKYNPWFGDAFWNSSKHSMIQYLLVVMTSWAIVADVWYLPAMRRKEGESAMQFAERVKAVIAKKGGLVDCVWDGQLKRMHVKESYREEKRKELGELFATDEPILAETEISNDVFPTESAASNEHDDTADDAYLEMKRLPRYSENEISENSKQNEPNIIETLSNLQSSGDTETENSAEKVNAEIETSKDEINSNLEDLKQASSSEESMDSKLNTEAKSDSPTKIQDSSFNTGDLKIEAEPKKLEPSSDELDHEETKELVSELENKVAKSTDHESNTQEIDINTSTKENASTDPENQNPTCTSENNENELTQETVLSTENSDQEFVESSKDQSSDVKAENREGTNTEFNELSESSAKDISAKTEAKDLNTVNKTTDQNMCAKVKDTELNIHNHVQEIVNSSS